MQGFETHRCDGSLRERCPIRKFEVDERHVWPNDGYWHLYSLQYDYEFMRDYLTHVAVIDYCPFCGKELT